MKGILKRFDCDLEDNTKQAKGSVLENYRSYIEQRHRKLEHVIPYTVSESVCMWPHWNKTRSAERNGRSRLTKITVSTEVQRQTIIQPFIKNNTDLAENQSERCTMDDRKRNVAKCCIHIQHLQDGRLSVHHLPWKDGTVCWYLIGSTDVERVHSDTSAYHAL